MPSFRKSSIRSTRLAAAYTLNPDAFSSRATILPIPEDAPVTNATLLIITNTKWYCNEEIVNTNQMFADSRLSSNQAFFNLIFTLARMQWEV